MMGCPPQGSSQHIIHTETDPKTSPLQAQPLTTTSQVHQYSSSSPYRSSHPLASQSHSGYTHPPDSWLSQQQSPSPAESLPQYQTHFSPVSPASHPGQHFFSSGQSQYQQQPATDCPSSLQHQHPQKSYQRTAVQGPLSELHHQLLPKHSRTLQHTTPSSDNPLLQPHQRTPGTASLHSGQQYSPDSLASQFQAPGAQAETFSRLPPSGAGQGPNIQAQAAGTQAQVSSVEGNLQTKDGSVQIFFPQASETPVVHLHCQQEGEKSVAYQQYRLPPAEHSPSDMLDKKPTLQVMTADHSPSSPGSSTSSPRFIFPDMQRSSSSGHLASDSGSSPFMSPIKREVKWESGTPPHSSELDLPAAHPPQQAYRERVRMYSGDTEPSETLVDSETGSSLLEDSSSSREQSPFSAMAESLSLRSPSEHSPSPLARKVFQRQTIVLASEDEEPGGDDSEGGGAGVMSLCTSQHHQHGASGDVETNPPKLFKKRLHERYVLSLQDCPPPADIVKEEMGDNFEGEGLYLDPKRPLTKTERSDSPHNSESSLPKSPRRSSSDTDNIRSEMQEMGASSADEGDVFMEPKHVRTKTRPPSLRHQREPLDLSRGTFYSGHRTSPLVDPEHLSPAMTAPKHFSPPSLFRSPHSHHRLPPHQYSPHQGLLSPQQQQSQSPLCSVPEGGRIFNFNVPSPLEGAHSDSDLISPNPMSPRIFTFPPQGMMNPMAEVNRLAVSPRAPYTPPPQYLHGKALGSPGGSGLGGLDTKVGEQHGFYGKRSLSESDMTYLCPVCGQVFPTNDNLAKHMAKHLPTETIRSADNNKVHYCKVCNRSFSRSDMLTRHMRLHTGLKPYECGDCGQVFSRSDHLNTHRRTHTGEKPYRCPQCPYAACRRDMITRHMRTHVKRTSRRGRYLSVPDDGDGQKSGSISSAETTDSVGGNTCSVSSIDSADCESPLPPSTSTRHSYIGTSVDSLLSPEPEGMLSPPPPGRSHHRHTFSSSGYRPSEDLDEEEGLEKLEGSSRYDRFMHYRKARNWSTTSLESVDSEEASLIREVYVDDAFQESEMTAGEPEEGSGVGARGQRSEGGHETTHKDAITVETHSFQKCFISRDSTGSSGGSS